MPVTISTWISIARFICVHLLVLCVWEWVGVAVLEVLLGTSFHEETYILPCLTVGPTLRTGIRSCAMGWSMHPTPNCRWGCARFPFLSTPLPAPLSFEVYSRVLNCFCLSILKPSLPWGFPREEVETICIEWMWLLYFDPRLCFLVFLGMGM